MSSLESIPTHLFRQANFVDGAWIDAIPSASIDVTNPATGECIGSIPIATREQVRNAIRAAHESFPTWRRQLAADRARLLKRIHAQLIQHQEPLARLLTSEQGKPLGEARAEIAYSASYFEWFAEEARRVYGDVLPTERAGTRMLVLKEPIGVAATITPWNFPMAMLARKIAPALAAGCTVVSKPSELTPFSALALASIAEQAGLPRGVWNVVTGVPSEIGAELCDSPLVRKLSFTGSTQTGKLLMRACAGTLKRLSLELGGNAPFIVFDSADIDAAVRGAIASKYRNSGQTCVCVNRFLVHASVYDEFASKLVEASKGLRMGNGVDESTDLGPLIDDAAVEKVERHIADAVSCGGTILWGGKRAAAGKTFFEPTVIGEATALMRLAKEETFGPVAALFRFESEEEAIALANNTSYGLAAYFYSRDLAQIWRVAEQLQAGMIGINEGMISSATIPFGGINESGFGREGGRYGIDDYTHTKYLCLGGL